jgi:hypothetical protein
MSDVIEAAPTGRASCRGCRQRIDKGALRFGERVPNPFAEGETTHWFHLACAADDRAEKLRAALGEFSGEVPGRADLEQAIVHAIASPKLANARWAERASSGRARCQECRETIDKDSLRIAEQREPDGPMGATSWVHAACGPKRYGGAGLLQKLRRTSQQLGPADLDELARILEKAAG